MDARFYDPHEGIAGPGVPLPSAVAEVVRRWDGATGDTGRLADEITSAIPDGRVDVHPPGWTDLDGQRVNEGMVTLRVPAKGFPAHCWRAIRFESLAETT